MKKLLIVTILLITVLLCADLSDPVLAITSGTEEGRLIYDQEKGIARNGEEILLACYRTEDAESYEYELVAAYSNNSGETYYETIIATYDMSLSDELNLLTQNRYAPVVKAGETGDFLIFYINLETSKPMLTTRASNIGEYLTEPLDIPERQYVQFLKNGEDFQIVTYGDMNYPIPLSRYSYFTNTNFTENDEYEENDILRFWGPDVFYGPVHSNDDIWIQNAGGGSNNGWPTFYEMVSTGGTFRLYPTGEPASQSAPMDDIFLGGWEENVRVEELPGATDVRQFGFNLAESESRDVLYVKIDGNTAYCRYADKITEIDTFTVYNSFPDDIHAFPIGDSIWTNEVEIPRLEWDENTFNLTLFDQSVFVHCELWIEGTVSGFQTWASADTIYITDDLLYSSVIPGEAPTMDTPDMLGLISEERIYIQYKNYDPDNETIQSPNCDGVMLYGSFAAIGDGDIELYGNMNTHYEGVFTFNYQHPHGSTPGFTYTFPGGEEWEIEFPDFHKYIFPPSPFWTGDPGFYLHSNDPVNQTTCGYPYEDSNYGDPVVTPYGTDYPFLNPVYPEGVSFSEMGERGVLDIYGGVQQFRRGFMHRSGTDPNSHPDNEYDLENFHYGGTHMPTGYEYYNHWDCRLDETMPVHYPKLNDLHMNLSDPEEQSKLSIYSFDESTSEIALIDSYIFEENNYRFIDNCQQGDETAFLLNINPDSFNNPYILSKVADEWSLIAVNLNQFSLESIDIMGEYYMLKSKDKVLVVDEEGEICTDWMHPSPLQSTDYTNVNGDYLHYLSSLGFDNYIYHIDELISYDESIQIAEYGFELSELDEMEYNTINVYHPQNGEIVLQILDRHGYGGDIYCYSTYNNIYLAAGEIIELPETEDEIVSAELNLKIYPNPFNPQTTISYTLCEDGLTVIDVYNVKGQKVDSVLKENQVAGQYNIVWNAEGINSGMYFLRIKAGSKTEVQKALLLK